MTIQTLPESNRISQFTLARFVKLSNQIYELKAEQADFEYALTAALGNGCEVEPVTHTAQLNITEMRNVQWKSVVIRLKGEGYASQVLSHTKPKTFTKLIVR